MDRSKVSGKGFDVESRLFLVLLASGVLNIKERKVHLPEDESWGNNTDQERPKEAAGA